MRTDDFDYNLPWEEIMDKGPLQTSGGWTDMSVRRKWLYEIGGFDEKFIAVGVADMDTGSRLSGKVDNGQPSEILFSEKGKFNNLGLNFCQPFEKNFFSVTCSSYPGHLAKEDLSRQKAIELNTQYYLKMWGIVHRNENRVPIKYKILEIK